MEEVVNQQQSVSTAVVPSAPAAPDVSAQTAAPVVEPTVTQAVPPQAEEKPKKRDAEARINQLIARNKLTADELDKANAKIAQYEAAPNADGSGRAAPVQEPGNPYAPVGTGPYGEVTQDDLEGLSPVMRQMYDRVQAMTRELDAGKATTAMEQSIAASFEAYPEIAGVVDDGEIALEANKRRVPNHNLELVFAARTVPILREENKGLKARIAELETELHKDTVASPVTGSTKPAPPDQTEPVYKPGERMAAARRKAAESKG